MFILKLVLLCLVTILITLIVEGSKRTDAIPSYPQQLFGIEQDPFVQAAPFVIAIACRDGVAIVAATSPPLSTKRQQQQQSVCDDEPLVYYDLDVEDDGDEYEMNCTHQNISESINYNKTNNEDRSILNDTNNSYPFLDLPDSYAGPYRIQSIDQQKSFVTSFVSCGWKADGYTRLLNAARDIVDNERYTFGEVCNTAMLADQLSLYMTQCAVSERFRALSCTALLGCINHDSTNNIKHGCLWFVDVTGAYPVRALCMGGGTISIRKSINGNKNTNSETKSLLFAEVINNELLYQLKLKALSNPVQPPPYFDITIDEAFVMILDLLSTKDSNILTPSNTLIPFKSRLELAYISSQRPTRMMRKRISNIWGKKAIITGT